MKIGKHEFEAEGDPTTVQMQLEIFKELVKSAPAEPDPVPEQPSLPLIAPPSPQDSVPQQNYEEVDAKLSKIMAVKERVVSLTVSAENTDEAVLLIIYGQKILRNNDAINGFEIMEGLKESGAANGVRTDRVLERLARNGQVIAIGAHRSKKYRINNQGLRTARQLATNLLASVM